MSGLSTVILVPLGLVLVVVLCAAIAMVRRDHPHHVHTLWYLFSLTLCSVSVLFLYIYKNAVSIQNTPLSGMPGRVAVMFLGASMDVREELLILGTFAALFILPQILSYFISGVFGCGSPPILVSTVSRIVIWSLVKFFCVLSGILAAQSIFALYGQPYLYPKDSAVKFVEALLMISISFLTMAAYYSVEILYDLISNRFAVTGLEAFSRFMTRYRESAAVPMREQLR